MHSLRLLCPNLPQIRLEDYINYILILPADSPGRKVFLRYGSSDLHRGKGMKGKIFAIGGGEIRFRETLEIDKAIVASAEKENPSLLFIPTASAESDAYIQTVEQYFGNDLGCNVDTLRVINGETSSSEARSMILNSDIIYVGGGNTQYMMEIWHQYKVNKSLKEAYDSGITLSGLSAGSICWFNCGQSDSNFTDGKSNGRYSCVEGLGLIPLLHAPHHNEDHRSSDLPILVKEKNQIGIALSNGCALEVQNDQYRLIGSLPEAYALIVKCDGQTVIENKLKIDNEYRPLSHLTDKGICY